VELKLGRSAWPRGRPGERGRSPVRGGVLDVEAWGSLGVGLELGRSTWPRGRPGKRSRSPVYPECSTSRPGDRSTAPSWNSAARPVSVVDQGNVVAPCLPGVLDVEASGSLGVELELGRSAWPVVDQGNVVPTARRPEGNAVAPSLPGVSTSRPRDHSTWS
jgi:hypothetical protein